MSSRRRAGALIGALVLVCLGVGALRIVDDDTAPRASRQPTVTATTAPVLPPERLVIDSIDVDAEVEPVGINSKGEQEVPDSIEVTGWWRDGSKPGEPGNVVIVGHTASKDDGVFDDLERLGTGDTVKVSSGSKVLAYEVTKEQEIKVGTFATVADEIYRRSGKSGIVLMTCGDWNGATYETTVIVTAALRP